jgi:hypothetical protein
MKRSGTIYSLSVLAVILVAANIYMRRPGPRTVVAELQAATNSSQGFSTLDGQAPPGKGTGNVRAAAETLPFQWKPIESTDYKQYIQNLKSLGFPDGLIREIIIADINKLYEPREKELKIEPAPPDAPASQRRRKPVPEDIGKMKQYQSLLIEKQRVLEALLGTRVPREMIRTPNSRNWEAYEYAINLLPPEKQDAVKYIQENLWIQDDADQSGKSDYLSGDKTELQAWTRAAEERDAELKLILTPDEFEKYERLTSPTGSELARNTVGMEPTEEEMIAMFKVTDDYWQKTGGVHGRWRAIPVPREEIAAADQQLKEDLRRVLGPERYIDYQMATTEMGQQMNNLKNREGLPTETARQAFSIQRELDQLNQLGRSQYDPRLPELEESLRETLGEPVWEDWKRGRNIRYELEP